MTPEEFEKKMRDAVKESTLYGYTDEEAVHICMDSIMCKLLRELGYGAGIDVFVKTRKWYS